MSGRGNYLQHPQNLLLVIWAKAVHDAFATSGGHGPYLVGSCTERADYRDVDLRMMLDDDRVDELTAVCQLRIYNMTFSLWGQQATGLPIDFQIQKISEANAEYGGRPRHALWIAYQHETEHP